MAHPALPTAAGPLPVSSPADYCTAACADLPAAAPAIIPAVAEPASFAASVVASCAGSSVGSCAGFCADPGADSRADSLAAHWVPAMELVRMSLGAGAGAGADADADAATARFADLRERVRNCLDVARSGARRAGFDDQQIETALFAVLAWIDEEAMTRDWAGASAWRRTPLQHEQFATNRAGALFFERLAALPLTAHAVREVYALVLLAGFTGRYAARPVAELDTLRAAQLDLLAAGAPPLAAGQPLFAPGAVLVATKAPRRVRAGLRRHRLAPILLFVVPVALLGGLYTAYALALARQAARLVAG